MDSTAGKRQLEMCLKERNGNESGKAQLLLITPTVSGTEM